ncbi:MAG TPA: hypothetical protein VGI40_13160 [Pirellulaceae bacterium]|jgi:hypothetical protein
MFRFTIRDLLWLMVIVAVAGAWLYDRKADTAWRNRVVAGARQISREIERDYGLYFRFDEADGEFSIGRK